MTVQEGQSYAVQFVDATRPRSIVFEPSTQGMQDVRSQRPHPSGQHSQPFTAPSSDAGTDPKYRELGRLTIDEADRIPRLQKMNPKIAESLLKTDINSFHYKDACEHIKLQRNQHVSGYITDEYRINQAVKHAVEDGWLTEAEVEVHTTKMNTMSTMDALQYQKKHLNFPNLKMKY